MGDPWLFGHRLTHDAPAARLGASDPAGFPSWEKKTWMTHHLRVHTCSYSRRLTHDPRLQQQSIRHQAPDEKTRITVEAIKHATYPKHSKLPCEYNKAKTTTEKPKCSVSEVSLRRFHRQATALLASSVHIVEVDSCQAGQWVMWRRLQNCEPGIDEVHTGILIQRASTNLFPAPLHPHDDNGPPG